MTGLEPFLFGAAATAGTGAAAAAGTGAAVAAGTAAAASTASYLGTAATIAGLGGTALSAIGSIQQGRAQQSAANYAADQANAAAKQTEAKAIRDGIEQKRRIDLARSSAVNIAGGDGSLASPTVANILGGFDHESDVAFNNTLIQGQEQATAQRTGATVQRAEGRNAKRAGVYGALGTTLSLAEKYGAGIKTSTSASPSTAPDIIGSYGSSTIR